MTLFRGLAVALATPFTEADTPDLPAFRRLVRQVAAAADVLVPLGSTGEAATLTDEERDALIQACVEEAAGKAVLVGTGSGSTRQAAAWTRHAQELGAQGALVVTPPYNKPTPDGLVEHFRVISAAAPGFPLVVYNVPGRTGLNLTPRVLGQLWENPQVVAVKESSGDLGQIGEIARSLPPGKTLLAGDDPLALPSLALGAEGLVSVLGNALPRDMKALVDAALGGRRAEALEIHQRLLPLMGALFAESNPIPLKALLARQGLCSDRVRLPLVPASEATRRALASAWRAARAVEVA